MQREWTAWLMVLVGLACFGGGSGCGGEEGDDPVVDVGLGDAADAAGDAGADADVGVGDAAADTADASADASPGGLCSSCVEDEDCGGAEDRCVTLPAGDLGCASACDEETACPEGYFCATLGDGPAASRQCVPEALTCDDRCAGVTCGDGEICDPWTGACMAPLGTCEAGCTNNAICGDGPEDICINVNDNERVCSSGCDPTAEVAQCPTNFFCAALNAEQDPSAGVCFPLDQTCTDQCAGVDCAEGFNCDQTTGSCVEAVAGYCEAGCERDAQCAGPNDRCLNLGISEGARCWQDCTERADACAPGYECQRLQRTTFSLCIPVGQSCDLCDGLDCYPDGVCDPTAGECVERAQDCTQTGCEAGEICDPVSTQCVAIGRRCSGDSWAADCDNVVTSCTTRRPGTQGVCAALCTDGATCGAGQTCEATSLQTSLCLGEDFGGAAACGTMTAAASDVGAPCGAGLGTCGGDAPICVEAGSVAGFCTRACNEDSDCDGGQRCGGALGGQQVCVPTQCECATGAALGPELAAALERGLGVVELSVCDLGVESAQAAALVPGAGAALAADQVDAMLRFPMRGVELIRERLGALAGPSDGAAAALEAAAGAAGWSITAQAAAPSFPGPESALTQAVAEYISAAGGTPDLVALEAEAADVPAAYQALAAPIISAAAQALSRRDAALQAAGWSAQVRERVFEGAPYLFLPGTTAEQASAPDLSNVVSALQLEAFPAEALAQAAADLAATVDAAQLPAEAATWTGFRYLVDTPAGKIVLGDALGEVYDPSVDSALAGGIAVLLDAGGDDVYRVAAGANQSVENGVSLLVDFAGEDAYGYVEQADPEDVGERLASDAAGRAAGGDLAREDGPVSLSTTGRQGAGRVGIGVAIDLGASSDSYRSLRMSQGASVFGVGLLYDDGGAEEYVAEALAQGAALGGLGVLWDEDGADEYTIWHAGQGFGTGAGVGVLRDEAGNDAYEAVRGGPRAPEVLYFSLADRAASNRSLAQGAGAGVPAGPASPGLAGGVGLLSDGEGDDRYVAATFAQGYGAVRGVGALHDQAGGDTYDGRGSVQGAGEDYGAGVLFEDAGSDIYNAAVGRMRQNGQGSGRALGWGVLWERGGDDEVTYATPGGGVGRNGGYGFAFFAEGADVHTSAVDAGWGLAVNDAPAGDALEAQLTLGLFLDAGAQVDSYARPNAAATGIEDGATWTQPDVTPPGSERGVGVDE